MILQSSLVAATALCMPEGSTVTGAAAIAVQQRAAEVVDPSPQLMEEVVAAHEMNQAITVDDSHVLGASLLHLHSVSLAVPLHDVSSDTIEEPTGSEEVVVGNVSCGHVVLRYFMDFENTATTCSHGPQIKKDLHAPICNAF
jgi:hypothetical protein